jgi:hypothetical protein
MITKLQIRKSITYLDTLEDPTTGMPKYPTPVMFLVDAQKEF